MLKIEHTEVVGWNAAIRGMRNPLNSWAMSDSGWDAHVPPIELRKQVDWESWAKHYKVVQYDNDDCTYDVGPNDQDLMTRLRNSGPDHRKFMRMLAVYLDITAPLYWWKEFKTYRAGRKFGDDEPDIVDDGYLEYDIEMNSCSTMHKIASKEFTMDDFSCEHILESKDVDRPDNSCCNWNWEGCEIIAPIDILEETINILNKARKMFLETKDKRYWWQMIQLLPSSYNQKRTLMLNYEVLANMYKSRRNHKLDEWHTFCDWVEGLPYSELITGKEKNDGIVE